MLRGFVFNTLLVLAAVLAEANDTAATLQTSDTVMEFAAGENAPRVLSLSNHHHTFINSIPETLIDGVEIGGRWISLHWRFVPESTHQDSHRVAFVYENQSPRLRLTWEWQARRGFGPIEHAIRIENLDSTEVTLPLQSSFQFNWDTSARKALENSYIEKGAGKPSCVGTHVETMAPGYKWVGTSSTYAHPKANEPREIIPWFLVQQARGAQDGWYVGVEFSGRVQLTLERDERHLRGTVGLNPAPGPFRTRLNRGEIFETPTVFLGATRGGLDAAGSVLRRWVREVLGNPISWRNPNYPLLVNNSWGGGMKVNEQIAEAMIRDAADLGLEMFHVDAGWFRGVGDWYPDPQKFPRGLAPIADYAHQHGLKFGLWVDWTQAGLDQNPGALNARDPKVQDWLLTDLPSDWKPEEFKGETIDIGVPAAKAWAQDEVERIVSDYHLDMLEHDGYLVAQGCDRSDHPHVAPGRNKCVYKDEGFYWVESSNSTDVSYHAALAYYDIYTHLRKQHPGLLLEVCNDGGRMVDFGSAAHADYFSITDSYDPLSNRQAFYDASHVLPGAMLESYVEKWPTPTMTNFLYMLRSGMMGWLTIMIDTTQWTPEQHAAAKEEIKLYKTKLRPLIRDANLYHIAPRPDGVHWDGIEYFDPKSNRGVVYAFRGSGKDRLTHTYFLKGLQPDAKYRLHFNDHTAADRATAGRDLMQRGLPVTLLRRDSSELIFLDQLP